MAKVTKEDQNKEAQKEGAVDAENQETTANNKQDSEAHEAPGSGGEKPEEAKKEGQSKAEKQEDTSKGEGTQVEQLQVELAEQKEKFLRMYSEFENFRRRTAKEKIELMGTATENLMKELLSVLDDFERAEQSFGEKKDDDPVREGFNIIHGKLKKTLEKQGLKEMESPVGKDFDTEVHEAVTQFPAPEEKLKGKVIDQLEKGYYLNQKVIRYAKVVVGS